MFDDQQPQGGAVPGNLPIGEPEDIFSQVDRVDTQDQPLVDPPVAQEAPPVVPPPAEPAQSQELPATALASGKLTPKQTEQVESMPQALDELPPTPVENAIAQPPEQEAPLTSLPPVTHQPHTMSDLEPVHNAPGEYQVTEPSITRGLMTLIVIGVVIGILGFGGWFVYAQFVAPSTTQNPDVLTDIDTLPVEPVVTDQVDTTDPIEQETPETPTFPPRGGGSGDSAILFGNPIDFDDDGLDDEQEATLGTDPQNWDTDGDGLSDGVEVVVWNTDPLAADTDNDGYVDGVEVRSGYNPNGPGKLPLQEPAQPNTATATTTTVSTTNNQTSTTTPITTSTSSTSTT